MYLSLIKYFDKILDRKFKSLLYPILKELPVELPSSIQNHFNSMSKSESSQSSNNLNDFDLLLLDENESSSHQYYKLSLELVEPVENLDTPIRFQPGLVSLIKIKATLNNFNRFDNLFIQVNF